MSAGPVSPPATLGLLGGGQLGRMIALEARRMGYRAVVLDPSPDCPAAQVCDRHVRAPFKDAAAVEEFARACDVVTLEWELIPMETLESIARLKPLFPAPPVLSFIQDRLRQREFLASHGLPQTAFAAASSREELRAAAKKVGLPAIAKKRREGYDGKGQWALSAESDLDRDFIDGNPCVLEARVDFEKEISVILARGREGEISFFPVAENEHRDGILRVTRAPAPLPADLERRAREIGAAVAEKLGHVGVLAVELFVAKTGELLVNEIAPRVHNSGHFSFGACATSQFEQHLRAVCGLPLGDPRLLSPAVMVNLLGELWSGGEPDWSRVLRRPELRLHLYGKAKPAPGRKMGHLLALHENLDQAGRIAVSALGELAASRRKLI
ncbi:MAG: 5-(carboxyamino)imidazole ribonucleotide synthase [Elusimicrobia bacterium]|nr:5-(carboxyamino)imidazole ribonucleotide synthase [Elusimicrobiota bacterium]